MLGLPFRENGLTRNGKIYDFARSIVNSSEFYGGCFSPNGETTFLNQQCGEDDTPHDSDSGITYAIWSPSERARRRTHRHDRENHGDRD